MSRMVYYTATIIRMDGSDTNAYGEACEPGHGYTEQTGWWSPEDDYWSVQPDRANAHPDVYPPSGDLDPAKWLANRLTERIGPIEHFDGARTFHSAREVTRPREPTPGVPSRSAVGPPAAGATSLMAAGHAHGFTHREILHAARLLNVAPDANAASSRPLGPDDAQPSPLSWAPIYGRAFSAPPNAGYAKASSADKPHAPTNPPEAGHPYQRRGGHR